MILTQNMTLNPKITYLRQQLTSLVSLRYFRTAGMAERHLSTDRVNPSHTCHTDTTHRERMVHAWRRRRELRSRRGGGEGTHCIIHILREETRSTPPTSWSRERRHGQREAILRGEGPLFQLLPFSERPRASFISLPLSLSGSVNQLITVTHRTAITTAAIVTSRRALLAAGSTRLPASRDHRLPSLPFLRCTLRVPPPPAISPLYSRHPLPLRRTERLALPLLDSLVDLSFFH